MIYGSLGVPRPGVAVVPAGGLVQRMGYFLFPERIPSSCRGQSDYWPFLPLNSFLLISHGGQVGPCAIFCAWNLMGPSLHPCCTTTPPTCCLNSLLGCQIEILHKQPDGDFPLGCRLAGPRSRFPQGLGSGEPHFLAAFSWWGGLFLFLSLCLAFLLFIYSHPPYALGFHPLDLI